MGRKRGTYKKRIRAAAKNATSAVRGIETFCVDNTALRAENVVLRNESVNASVTRDARARIALKHAR